MGNGGAHRSPRLEKTGTTPFITYVTTTDEATVWAMERWSRHNRYSDKDAGALLLEYAVRQLTGEDTMDEDEVPERILSEWKNMRDAAETKRENIINNLPDEKRTVAQKWCEQKASAQVDAKSGATAGATLQITDNKEHKTDSALTTSNKRAARSGGRAKSSLAEEGGMEAEATPEEEPAPALPAIGPEAPAPLSNAERAELADMERWWGAGNDFAPEQEGRYRELNARKTATTF